MEHNFHGVYHDITAPERIIQTFEYEGLPESGHVALEIMILEEKDGKTIARGTSVFGSVEDRDGMIQSGMETGASASYDALAALVENK